MSSQSQLVDEVVVHYGRPDLLVEHEMVELSALLAAAYGGAQARVRGAMELPETIFDLKSTLIVESTCMPLQMNGMTLDYAIMPFLCHRSRLTWSYIKHFLTRFFFIISTPYLLNWF